MARTSTSIFVLLISASFTSSVANRPDDGAASHADDFSSDWPDIVIVEVDNQRHGPPALFTGIALAPKMQEHATSRSTVFVSASSLLFFCFVLLIVGHEMWHVSEDPSWLCFDARFCMTAAALTSDTLKSMEYTAMVPISWDLVQATGFGPVVSGVLISCLPGCIIAGSNVCWMFADQIGSNELRKTILLCLLGISAANFAIAMLLTSSTVSDSNILAGMIVLRCAAGFMVGAIDFSFQRICVQCLLPNERADYFIGRPGFVVMGYGLGPLLSGSVIGCFNKYNAADPSVFLVGAVPVVLISLVFALLAFLTCLIPTSAWNAHQPDYHNGLENKKADEIQSYRARNQLSADTCQLLMLCTFMFQFVRSFTVAAVEVSSAFILEVEFGWKVGTIGIVMGAVLVLSAVIGIFVMARISRHVRDMMMMCGFLCVNTCFAATLLFKPIGILCPNRPELLILAADALMYSSFLGLSGIVEGVAVNATIPRTAFSAENFLVIKGVIANGARTLAAPCARGLIAHISRDAYAGLQLSLTLICAATCWKLASLAVRSRQVA